MDYPTAEQIIKQEYEGCKNFMTPHVIRYGKIRSQTKHCKKVVAYELSSGRGFRDNTIYGVSVVSWDPITNTTERMTKLSDCFGSLRKAEDYIEILKEREDL